MATPRRNPATVLAAGFVTLFLSPAAPASAEEPPAVTETATAATPLPATAEAWLQRLEELALGRGGLDARLRYTTVQGLLDDEQIRYGRLRQAGGGPGEPERFRIDLDGEAVDGNLRPLHRTLTWDGEQLLDVDALRHEANVRILDGQADLAETLPIPMRVDAAELLAQYEVELVKGPEAAAGSDPLPVHLRLRSRTDEAADPLEVWFDPTTGLPVRGRSGRVGGDTQTVDLVGVEAVDAFDAGLFDTTPPTGPGWRVQGPASAG